jgi:peroxiredoxin
MSRNFRFSVPLLIASFICCTQLHAQATLSTIDKEMLALRIASDADRSGAIKQIALEIRTLPAGAEKVKEADALEHLSTAGAPGIDMLQTVADTLAASLSETPMLAGHSGQPPVPYIDLAKLARYEGIKTTISGPLYADAMKMLVENDVSIATPEFTLKDIHGKKVTFSELKGKIVLINFWSTGCQTCKKEMADLDALYTYFEPQGLVVLSITSNEESWDVAAYLRKTTTYNPDVLFDSDGKVAKQFHVDGTPRTFLYNRNGKLIAEAIDMRTRQQLLQMLSKTDLHAEK